MEKLKAYYFTGTGNTRYVTEKLCGYLQDRYDTETFDVTKTASVSSADLLLFAFPVYGSSPPKPMVRFVLNNAHKIRGQECIVIATQYKFSGDGAASLGRLLEKTGAKVSFAEHFNMPNNLSDCAMFKICNGAELKDTLERAEKKAQCFAGRILKGKKFRRGFNPLSHSVGYVCQRKWWRKGENEKKSSLQIDAQKCVGCGLCAGRCPVHNIRIENGKAVPQSDCALCYRCVNLCPKQAIRLFGKEFSQPQYKGPSK
jgi:ferredoxin